MHVAHFPVYNFIICYLRVITYTYSGVNIFTNISVVPITPVRKIPIRHILSSILATYFHSSSWFGTKTSRSVEFSLSVSPGRVPLVWVSTSLVPFSFSCEFLTSYFWAPLFPFSISDWENFSYIRPKQNICLFKLPPTYPNFYLPHPKSFYGIWETQEGKLCPGI